jgi:diacylglycerol kinase (ATP)
VPDIALILNPHAGKGKAGRLFPALEQKLRAQGLTFDVHETTGPGHATEIARAEIARGVRTLIAAGGDGTIRELAGTLAGASTALGIIPLGSGNDFIKSLGIPRDLDAACRVIAQGRTRTVDLIRIGADWCANAVGIGFDALVVVEASRLRWLRGLPLYLAAVLKAMFRYDCPRTVIELDGIPESGTGQAQLCWEQTILLIACANGQHYGGGFHIAPEAQVDDGLLDVCVIDAVNRFTILQKLLYVIRGTHAQLKEVKFYRARKVRLTSPDILYVEADGDLLPESDPHTLEIEVVPAALKVLVP